VRSSPVSPEFLIAVAVPVPGLGVLTYRVRGRSTPPATGARVQVPLGTRTITGCVVGPAAEAPPAGALRDVVSVVDDEPFLPPPVVALALWVAEYYAAGPGDALVNAMPPAARRGDRTGFRSVGVAEAVDGADPVLKGPRQREALAAIRAHRTGVHLTHLARQGIASGVVARLADMGAIRLRKEIVERDPFAGEGEDLSHWTIRAPLSTPPDLTAEQQTAVVRLQALADAGRFSVALLHGVTGSGKTEVYLRIAQHTLAAGGRALVLVPEIALTPALVGAFRARCGSRVAVQHSGLSAGERHDQWHRIRRGDVDVVIGTRSGVFAPIGRLRLIVVDEEHEPSYKQEDTPRYHARDVAVMRGRMEQALVVLGSATPSLESAANAASGRYSLIELRQRVLGRAMATVRLVDMRREMAARGAIVTFSQPLLDALDDRVARREQALVLLNRRGFATVIFCRVCGTSVECPRCSVNLTFHRAARQLRCHYCNHTARVPKLCTACGGEFLEHSGFGTERLEADLRERYPGARIARVDRDTVRRRGTIAGVLSAVRRGDIDILVGTQMIAKGHDFPSVTLVGVVSADVGLGMADFRAAERTFQLLTQVVGRAGRGDSAGEAIIQTLYPEHYSVRAAAEQDYATFLQREMEFRQAMHYPPVTSLINVVVKGQTLDRAMRDAADLAGRVRHRGAGQVLGPSPAALSKIKNEFRAQFFLKGNRRRAMREAVVGAVDERADLRKRVLVDVDPASVT
jgi:primosomal protein N' (replication factor Y) (superfamily II helicase)